jgi:hypothetical protein
VILLTCARLTFAPNGFCNEGIESKASTPGTPLLNSRTLCDSDSLQTPTLCVAPTGYSNTQHPDKGASQSNAAEYKSRNVLSSCCG